MTNVAMYATTRASHAGDHRYRVGGTPSPSRAVTWPCNRRPPSQAFTAEPLVAAKMIADNGGARERIYVPLMSSKTAAGLRSLDMFAMTYGTVNPRSPPT